MKKSMYRRAIIALLLSFCLSFLADEAFAQSYSWKNVQVIGGGYIPNIIAHPLRRGLFYARTDVLGAYRFTASSGTWTPLTDWTTAANWWQMGIDSIAIDPRNPNMFYAVAGDYSNNWCGDAVFLRSINQGASFTSVALPFHAGANDDGRGAGERLQVDPNLGSILFYGTHNDNLVTAEVSLNGLWTSTNGGLNWSQVATFPTLTNVLAVPTTYAAPNSDGAGVAFVAFDAVSGSPNAPTPRIFAGVSTWTMPSTLYVSENAGVTWGAVPGAPTAKGSARLFPTRGLIGADHVLYITYCGLTGSPSNAGPGPDNCSAGAVWKYDIGARSWTDITPPRTGGYDGLSLDAQHAGTLVVSTTNLYNPSDTMFYSTDGGATWRDIGATANRTVDLAPYMAWHQSSPGFGNWPTSVVIDPFNSDHVIYGTGGPIFETFNFTAQPSTWKASGVGIEEVVPQVLISPSSGAYLLSGLGDVCGFTHTSLTASPAAGMFQNPLCQTTTGLDWAKSAPSVIVRSGRSGPPWGAISSDGGATWTAFAGQPTGTDDGGSIAVSGDGAVILWAPGGAVPARSTDNGASWTQTSLPTGATVFSDGANARVFYAWSGGSLYVSGDQGNNWSVASSGVTSGGSPAAVYGRAGDVWLATNDGLFHSTQSGQGFAKLSGVGAATAVGFGKAASGASYPAIYLIGTVNSVWGIYRSTDAAASWQRINDTNHQWGGANVITGDPKYFGNVYIGARGIIYGTSPN